MYAYTCMQDNILSDGSAAVREHLDGRREVLGSRNPV